MKNTVYIVSGYLKHDCQTVSHIWGVYASLKGARKAVKQYAHAWKFTIKRHNVSKE